MNIKRILLIIFAVLIIIGSLGVMIRFSVPANKKPQEPNDVAPIVEPADVTEFYDFQSAMDWTNNGQNYYSDLATVYLKSGSFKDTEGNFQFSITQNEINNTYYNYLDPYIVIGNSYILEEYSKIVYEVDVKVSENYPFQIVIRPDYRYSVDEGSSQASVSSGIVCFSNSTFYTKESDDVLYRIDENEFHFTYVVNTDRSCQVFINGKLIYETDYAYDDFCYMIKGLRLSAQYYFGDPISGTATVTFDNIHVKGYYAEENTPMQ